MSNPYFDSGDFTPLPRHQNARAEAVNAIFDAVVVGFDNVPDSAAMKSDMLSFCVDTGTANAYIIAPTYPIVAYAAGQRFSFVAVHGNTGPSTVNVSAIGVAAIKRPDGNDLANLDIPAGRVVSIEHDGSNFQLMSAAGSDVTATAASAAAAAISEAAATSSASSASSSASAAATSATAAAASAATIAPTSGTFTPTDASGAGLTLTSPVGYYRKIGTVVHVWGSFTYPVTADGSNAKIGGLPFTSANLTTHISGFVGTVQFGGGGGTPGGSAPNWFFIIKNSTTASFSYGGGIAITNANLSTSAVDFYGTYPV